MRATGLDASELPYVAELMDVNEQNEQWRLAMNVAYAPIAQTILVDKRHEQGFAAKISAIDPNLMTRRTWRFVETAVSGGFAVRRMAENADDVTALRRALRSCHRRFEPH